MKPLLIATLLATSSWAGMAFVHPGALDSREELDFVKARIAEGAQPWSARFKVLKIFAKPGLDTVAPQDGNENDQGTDAQRAYGNALAWAYTGDTLYAEQGIGILNTWARTFQGYQVPPEGQGNQSQLNAGWIGALLGPAAEILRDYPGWDPQDIARLQEMFRSKFFPALDQMSPWNGNVDLTQIDALLNLAVFTEDQVRFEAGIERLRRRDSAYFYLQTDRPGALVYGGSSASAWSDGKGNPPAKWVDGLTQETCRDNGHHSQFALASALHAAEVAWHQGVDVYTESAPRFTAAMELLARQLNAKNMLGTCKDTVATTSRFDTWEIGYNHYRHRKGIALPNTALLLTQTIRPKSASSWNIFYETVTHADVSAPVTGIAPTRVGKPGVSLTTRRDGSLWLKSAQAGRYQVALHSLAGERLERLDLRLDAGKEQAVVWKGRSAPSGLRLIQVRSGSDQATFKIAP